MVQRRQLILLLVLMSASLSIGLAITSSLVAFEVVTFFVGFTSVVPQILIPLAADLAPPGKRLVFLEGGYDLDALAQHAARTPLDDLD